MASIQHSLDYIWATAFSLGNNILRKTLTNQRPDKHKKRIENY